MNLAKKTLALLLILVLALGLASCAKEEEMEETEAKYLYASQGGSVNLDGVEGLETDKRFSTAAQSGTLYVSFNGIQNRNTSYFQPGSGDITVTAKTTTDGPNTSYKVGLWKLTADNQAEYVNGCTMYFTADGEPYTGTFSGLDTSAEYKLTISYDSASYYLTGSMTVSPLATDVLTEAESDEAQTN